MCHISSNREMAWLSLDILVHTISLSFLAEKKKKKEKESKKKPTKKRKKSGKKNSDDEAVEDSDDMDEGKEVDYMTSSDR